MRLSQDEKNAFFYLTNIICVIHINDLCFSVHCNTKFFWKNVPRRKPEEAWLWLSIGFARDFGIVFLAVLARDDNVSPPEFPKDQVY